MKFRMQDGKTYQGRSYTAVVEHMMDDKLTEPRSTESYRRATAQRVADLYQIQVDATDDRSFIRSLVAGGVMEELPRRMHGDVELA